MTSCVHLTQIMLLYDLGQELHLLPPVSHDKDVKLPTCKSSMMFMNLLAHYSEPDPLYIFTPSIGPVIALSASLWTTLTATLATHFDKSASIIQKLIPKNTQFAQYGWACQLEGGDTMHAHELIPLRSDS